MEGDHGHLERFRSVDTIGLADRASKRRRRRCTTPIAGVADALDIVAGAYEHGASKPLLREADLPAAFFDLSTKVAGALVQKFTNYRQSVALVVVDENAYSELFRQFVREARTGRQFRTFVDEAGALAWPEGVG